MITVNGSQILYEQTDGVTSQCSDRGWSASFVSKRNPLKETSNEDCLAWYRVDDTTAVFAVADGCGGMRGGEQASRLALEALGASIDANRDRPNRLRAAILDGIEEANQSIRSLRIGAACTLAVVEYHRGTIRGYHAGDTQVLVMGVRGRIRYQSICHSPVGFAVESGWLGAEEAMHHEDRHLVSNVVGCDSMRIEIGPSIRLGALDTVVIGSDGLFDNVTIPGVVDRLRKGNLQNAVGSLVDTAIARMHGVDGEPSKPDDISVIALRPLNLRESSGYKETPDTLIKPR
jgi:serine/threonine protein phosphatase PrpC